MSRVLRTVFLSLTFAIFCVGASAIAQDTPDDGPGISAVEEARRTVEMMGGADRVRAAAVEAAKVGGREDRAWALKLSEYLLLLDPDDKVALSIKEPAVVAQESGPEPMPETPGEPVPVAANPDPEMHDRYLFPAADPWNIDKNYISGSVADARWTIDEDFPGTKLIMDGRYVFRQERLPPPESDCDCEPKPPATRVVGTLGAHAQWGEGESGLEYGRLTFSSVGYIRTYDLVSGKFVPLRDTLEWGIVDANKDDPLGIDDYLEFSLIRGSRTWQWKPQKSDFLFTLGIQGWVGYAWATSIDPRYDDVTNPIIGNSFKATVNRPRWGSLYIEQRVVNGYTFSSPSAGGSVSREARFRAGYINRLYGCLSLDVYIDKRSFNFTDHRLDDLYTKSQRIGAALGCDF